MNRPRATAWRETYARAAACGLALLSLAVGATSDSWPMAALLASNAVALAIVACRRAGGRTIVADAPPAAPPRATVAHPVSGLPMREALLARMSADGAGALGAVWFTDFDRLAAFDPVLGDHVFAAITERLRRMLPPDRLAAHVDRGKVGIWFADGGDPRAELDAIGYALGEAIEAQGVQMVPAIKLRLSVFDAGDGISPGTFLSRTLASFALPESAIAAPVPMADHTERARERYALEQDLRQAVARRELSLAYQPLIDAEHGRVSGAEALIRWTHPQHGAIPPSRFVPIMETAGLASEIGLWALNTAVREAQGWAVDGLAALRVAVNVSGLQLEGDDLPVLVQRTLQRHELPARALEIELTESIATTDAAHCRQLFAQLRALGVSLAVDDFGTGYSGFSSLRNLRFDKIKIDREFVTDVDRRRDSQAICQSIVALGRGLGIRVLAEGVERQAEFAWLRRHGCHHFQGYYFAAPLAPDAFRAFVRDEDGLAALLRWEGAPAAIEERWRA